MLDTNLNASFMIIYTEGVANTKLVVKSKESLAGVDEVPSIFPDVEADQV